MHSAAVTFPGALPVGPAWITAQEIEYTAHRGVAQPGSALRSGRRGRGFKSRHPDGTGRPSGYPEGRCLCLGEAPSAGRNLTKHSSRDGHQAQTVCRRRPGNPFLRTGTLRREHPVLAVCAGVAERDLFLGLGFSAVMPTNVHGAVPTGDSAPLALTCVLIYSCMLPVSTLSCGHQER